MVPGGVEFGLNWTGSLICNFTPKFEISARKCDLPPKVEILHAVEILSSKGHFPPKVENYTVQINVRS